MVSGYALAGALPVGLAGRWPLSEGRLYPAFKDPVMACRPFARWWWNGDKIEKGELARELRLLRDAEIGRAHV